MISQGKSSKDSIGIEQLFVLMVRQVLSRLEMKSSNETALVEKPSTRHAYFTPGSNTPNCECCNVPYRFFRWPHHCRECGRCVCSTCAPSTRLKNLAKHGYDKPQRVCANCFAGKPPVIKYVMDANEDMYGDGLKFILNDSDLKISDEKWICGTTAYIHRGTHSRQMVAIKHYTTPVHSTWQSERLESIARLSVSRRSRYC